MSRGLTWGACAGLLLLAPAVGGSASEMTIVPARANAPGTENAQGTQGIPFSLYTHCGVHELHTADGWYERVGGVLDDGNGNPPAGWDNPEQRGTLAGSGPTVVFRDRAGHRETFRLRPGATSPKILCA
jgi:hypothetical protein